MIGKDMQFEANRKFLGIIIHIDSRYLPRKMSLQISCMPIHCLRNYIVVYACTIDTFQDFLIAEHMNPRFGNKHFFTKSCHCQTYQNFKISPQEMPISDFQSQFSMSKIIRIFLIFFSLKNINLGASLLLLTFFENFNF